MIETPIIKKLVPCGKTSRAVILPKSWIQYAEQKEGKHITAVAMEVDGSLILNPIFENIKDDVPSRQAEHITYAANQLVKKVCINV